MDELTESSLQELIRRWDSERELFTTISYTFFKIQKNLLRLTNLTIARQVLRIKSWIYESATELQACCYKIFLPETTKIGIITQNKGHFAVQGHSSSPILLPCESSVNFSENVIGWPKYQTTKKNCRKL